jgi:hypothetical protein
MVQIEVLWSGPRGDPVRTRAWYPRGSNAGGDVVDNVRSVKAFLRARFGGPLTARSLIVVARGRVWADESRLSALLGGELSGRGATTTAAAAAPAAPPLVLYAVAINIDAVLATLQRIGAPPAASALLVRVAAMAALPRYVLAALPPLSSRRLRARRSTSSSANMRHRTLLSTLARARRQQAVR